MNKRVMPQCNEITHLVRLLTNVEADVQKLDQPWPFNSDVFYAGTYASGDGIIRVIILMDLPLSASLAALLIRFMPGEAEDAINNKALNEVLSMNLSETLNIFAGKLNMENVPHVVFQTMHSHKELPEPLNVLLTDTSCERADYRIDLPDYFAGNMSILMFD